MNKDIMEYYIDCVKFLGIVLGPEYEVVLYDLRDNREEIIAIANGVISGRNVGDSLSENIKNRLLAKEYENESFVANYRSLYKGNKFLRASTLYIKNKEDELLGILCINFDDKRYEKVAAAVLSLCHPDNLLDDYSFQSVDSNVFFNYSSDKKSVLSYSKDLIKSTIQLYGDKEDLTKKDKLEILKKLEEKDILEIKSIYHYIADSLGISFPTLYRYIAEISKE